MHCKVDKCDSKVYAKELCAKHWKRNWKYGDPNIVHRQEGKGFTDKYGYRIVSKDGVTCKEHRYVMEQHLSRKLLLSENVHHINGNKTDNRIENLELWITKQPKGQRPEDLIAYAKEILNQYSCEFDDEYHGM